MTFERLHKLVLYAAVTLGLLPLATSGEVPLPFLAAAFAGLIGSWFYDAPVERDSRRTQWWTRATLVAFLVLLVLGWATGRYLLHAILFALVMIVTRLFQSRGSRDVFQLYGLSLIAMLAGAVINPTLSFVAAFIPYVVVLVWGLILLHLQRDIERLREEQSASGERPAELAWKARRLVTPRFLLGSSTLALLVFASSLGFFFFFPRLGMGFFFSQGRAQQQVSGFSDRIELGSFGNVKTDTSVVMRVRYPNAPQRANRRPRMRGISFDHYDGRSWSKSTDKTFELTREEMGVWRIPDEGEEELPGRTVKQRIYVEPMNMDQRMVFGQPRMRRLEIPSPLLNRLRARPSARGSEPDETSNRVRFFRDAAGDVSTRLRHDVALRYWLHSYVPRREPEKLRDASGETPSLVKELYLQLPDDLDPRIEELAERLTEGASTRYDRAVALEEHLRSEYDYSTKDENSRSRPLSDFLFDRKKGHCEYYATALVILARSLGIPARPANGFYGGSYNEYGHYYAMRQADAHSWAEIYFPGYGWVTFDATPPSGALVPSEGGVLGTVSEWIDSLRYQWYSWVVEYDLEKQLAMLRGLMRVIGGVQDAIPRASGAAADTSSWREGLKEWLSSPRTWAVLGTPVVLLLLWRLRVVSLLVRLLRWLLGRDRRVPRGEVGERYRTMLRLLRRRGFERATTETPRELARRVERSGFTASEPVSRISEAWETVRYGERVPDEDLVARMEADLRSIREARRPEPDEAAERAA